MAAELTLTGEEVTASTTQTQVTCVVPEILQPSPSVETSATFDCTADSEKRDGDIVMGNPEPHLSELYLPQNDNNLPAWLTQTIKYLRSVSEEISWQNLVTEFIAFEKSGPPQGVSQVFHLWRLTLM